MSGSKKMVIEADIHNAGCKRKALKAVSGLSGIDSIDIKDRKLTIFGDIDPVDVVGKLKKWNAKIVTVGPAKEIKDDKDGGKKEEEPGIKMCVENYPCMPQQYCVGTVVEEYPTSGCVIL